MLSIELIRKDADYVNTALTKRGDTFSLQELLDLDKGRRHAIQKGDELRARRNESSKRIAQMRDKPQDLIDELRALGEEIKCFEQEAAELGARVNGLLMELPNLPQDEVPPGDSEKDNVVLRTWGEIPVFDFTPAASLGAGRIPGDYRLPAGRKAVWVKVLCPQRHGR